MQKESQISFDANGEPVFGVDDGENIDEAAGDDGGTWFYLPTQSCGTNGVLLDPLYDISTHPVSTELRPYVNDIMHTHECKPLFAY